MNFNMNFNSEFERDLFTNVEIFTSHFNSININEKNILEIIGIAFYGGKYLTNTEAQLNNHHFDKYINLCIKHYAHFIAKELSSYIHYSNNEYNEKVIEITREINEYVKNNKEKDNSISYKTILHYITTFIKNKYMSNKNEYLYISNPLYKESFLKKYIAIDCIKYVEYLIIDEYFETICPILLLDYKKYISQDDIMNIKNLCVNEECETTFIYKLYEKMNLKNISYSDFNTFIQNILKNGIQTPYFYESSYKEYFENIMNHFSEKMDNILRPEHTHLFDFIENIKENIVMQGINSKELIDEKYPNICISEIEKNKLNINDFTTKMFYEYFMASKSEAQLALTLDKSTKVLQNIANKQN
jgi:hypothetical protein